MKVLFLSTFHQLIWRSLLSFKIICQKRREQQTSLWELMEYLSDHVAKRLAPTKALSQLREETKVQDSHHVVRLLAIFGDTQIVHHYSNWWWDPKGQLFTHFFGKKGSDYKERTKLLRVDWLSCSLEQVLKNIFFQLLISYSIKPHVISQC